MFERLPALPLPSPFAVVARVVAGRKLGKLLPIGVSAALAISLSLALGSAARAADEVAGNSIQYQEAVAHASQPYSFAPGGPVTVPYRPRPGDTTPIDGASPMALPAANGSSAAAPTLTPPGPTAATDLTVLRREVFGFLPYWELGSTLDYSTISTIAYFGTDLNLDGTLDRAGNGWNGWVGSTMTTVINNAHAHGTRVVLTVESMAWNTAGANAQRAVLQSPTASLTAAQQIAAEVYRRGADGVNLDFEPVAAGNSSYYIAFVRSLRIELDKLHPGYELTFCATGRPSSYDLAGLTAPGAADAVFIMGYDYRGGTPANTGSIDPLTSPWIYDLNDTVNAYVAQTSVSKIILGLPWYGHAWSTGTSNAVNAPQGDLTTYGQPASVYYSTAAPLAAQDPATTPCQPGWPVPCVTGKLYDTVEQTAWTAYYGTYGGGTTNTWRELYFDDARSLGARIDAIDGWNLRGVGIWALGYDNNNGDGDLTNAIAAKLEISVAPTTFHAVPPTRLLDTRNATGLAGAFSSHVARTFHVPGAVVPNAATAVTGIVTVTQQTSSGFIYVGPVPTNNPTSSTLNFPVGDDRANSVTVALSNVGDLSVTYAAQTTGPTAQILFDVTGYFTPDQTGTKYVPLAPTRILDSRNGTGGPAGPIESHAARTFQVTGTGSGVPANAVAVTGNLTVTQQTSLGFVYIGPDATNNPANSTLNFPKGDDRANSVTVALGVGGTLSVTYAAPTLGPTAHVVFDVTGYFSSDPGGASFVPVNPTRLLDSRYGIGASRDFNSHVARPFLVAGAGTGLPSSAVAVSGNLTVTQQGSLGYLYIGPVGTNDPTSSTLNFPIADDRANSATIAVGDGGILWVTYAAPRLGYTAQVIFDVTGYFTP